MFLHWIFWRRGGHLEPPGPIVKSRGGGGFISTIGQAQIPQKNPGFGALFLL